MEGKAALLQDLRREILSLGGIKAPARAVGTKTGLQELAGHFPFGVFPTGTMHEFLSANPEELAASTGFIAALLHTCLPDAAPVVWINNSHPVFPHSLTRYGIQPHNIIFIHPPGEKQINWCIEEALQCDSLSAVVAEIQELNFTRSRRFQLLVEKSRVTGFLIHTRPQKLTTTAAVTRWQIASAASELPEGIPGVGHPRWKVQLQKVRNGKPGSWNMEWIGHQLSILPDQSHNWIAGAQRKTG